MVILPGDIFVTKINYSGDKGPYKLRPVMVLNVNEEDVTIVEITTVPPKNPPGFYDLVHFQDYWECFFYSIWEVMTHNLAG